MLFLTWYLFTPIFVWSPSYRWPWPLIPWAGLPEEFSMKINITSPPPHTHRYTINTPSGFFRQETPASHEILLVFPKNKAAHEHEHVITKMKKTWCKATSLFMLWQMDAGVVRTHHNGTIISIRRVYTLGVTPPAKAVAGCRCGER